MGVHQYQEEHLGQKIKRSLEIPVRLYVSRSTFCHFVDHRETAKLDVCSVKLSMTERLIRLLAAGSGDANQLVKQGTIRILPGPLRELVTVAEHVLTPNVEWHKTERMHTKKQKRHMK